MKCQSCNAPVVKKKDVCPYCGTAYSVVVETETATLRALVTDSFSDAVLTDLCFDYFPRVYQEFGSQMGKRQKVQRLIEFCVRHSQVGALLELVWLRCPAQYERHLGAR